MAKEYIEREALIHILEAKAEMALGTPKQVLHGVVGMVGLLPASDVVEVVRCKDCKYYGTSGCAMDTYAFDVVEEGFCSYGERKEV